MREHARNGLLDVPLAGETVQDSVLPTAEGLVRNFLVAAPFYESFVDGSHPCLQVAWLEDAFGNGPNYPQVLQGVGAEVVACVSYRPCPDHLWVGIDGTALPCLDNHPRAFVGDFAKHPPCPECRGAGCTACGQNGLLFTDGYDLEVLRKTVQAGLAKHADSPWLAVRMLTEEGLPDAALADFVDDWNRQPTAQATLRLANLRDVLARHRPTLAAALARQDGQPPADLNPAMPGCMVSRIRCKQRTRAVAYHLVAAEAALASASWRCDSPGPPPADLTDAWRQVAFSQFHDAVTGTHVDSAYVELMAKLDDAQDAAQRHLPLGGTVSAAEPAFSEARGEQTMQLGKLEVRFDRIGILSVELAGRDVFGQFPPPPNRCRRRWRIGELTLEPDYGDAWGTRIACGIGPGEASIVALGDYHHSLAVGPQAIRWQGAYTGGDPKVACLEWTMTASASADGRRLDFRADVLWDTGSRRLRVQVPVRSPDPTATYEVPFGFIDRTFDSTKLSYGQWDGHAMEFPTLHWVRKAVDGSSGVALLNRGLPCNRWSVPAGGESGILDLSLLRSPEWAFAAVEPGSYEFWDIDGQRDAGRHVFEYALWPYVASLSCGELTRIGYAYNLPAPLDPPFRCCGDVVVTAWKPAEDGTGWILRLQETEGRGTTASLQFPEDRNVQPTDLLERPVGGPVRGRTFEAPVHRHGILTLHIR